jgi:hypothetical protein
MMRTVQSSFLAVICAAMLGVPAARAQQQSQGQAAQPIPAYHSPLASAADNGAVDPNADPQKLGPDTRSLTGVQDFSLGVPAETHSFWQPHFDLSGMVDSDPLDASGNTGWTTFTSFSGGVDLHRNSGNSALTLSYIGGGSFSNSGDSSNGVIQGLNLSEKLTYRRYAITFFDQLMYAPQTTLGATGLSGGPSLPDGGSSLGSGYNPGQSILTARGQRLINSTDAEVDAFLTARSSLTFVGGYSLLDSVDDSQLNYGNVIFSAGYNYQQSRANTFGLSYQYSAFNYSNFDQSIKTNVVLLSYGRRITGKLAFRVAGGPDIAFLHIPITTTPGGTGSPSPSSTTQVYGSFNANLQYQLQRGSLSASYNHGVTGGSGVLAGSVADNVTGTVARQFSRTFSGGWNVGYSRNHGLSVSGTTAASIQTFDYWFTGFNLSHPWGRSLVLNLSYQLQYQNSNAPVCTGPGCGTSITRNQISFGLGWRHQPISF